MLIKTLISLRSPLLSRLMGFGLMVMMAMQITTSGHAAGEPDGHDERQCIACITTDREDDLDPTQDKSSKKKSNIFFDHVEYEDINWVYALSFQAPCVSINTAVNATTNGAGYTCGCALIMSCRAPPA